MLAKFYLLHSLMSTVLLVVIAVNIFFTRKMFRIYEKAYQSDYWPRINARVVDVVLQKGALSRNSATNIQQNYNVIYNTCYQVYGQVYRKLVIKTAHSKEQAETMKSDNSIELTYNPLKPEKAFWLSTEKYSIFLMIFGILTFNTFGVGLAKSISLFL